MCMGRADVASSFVHLRTFLGGSTPGTPLDREAKRWRPGSEASLAAAATFGPDPR